MPRTKKKAASRARRDRKDAAQEPEIQLRVRTIEQHIQEDLAQLIPDTIEEGAAGEVICNLAWVADLAVHAYWAGSEDGEKAERERAQEEAAS